MKIIIVTGSVGTGKTALAKKLAKYLKYKYIDVNKVVEGHRLAIGYDRKRKSKIVDVRRLAKVLINLIIKSRESLIIDSHLSHYIPKKYVDLCIVTKCSLKNLKKRLKKKKYHQAKIKENLQVEIFDSILVEALERKHKVISVETDKKYNLKDIAKFI